MHGDAAEPAQDVRDVAPEDAAEGVQLVDHDVAQAHEERRPPLVARQDPHVQHLGIREHDLRVLPDAYAVVGTGVAVVGGRQQGRDHPRVEAAQLVLGECLGREDEQRRRRVAPERSLDDRDLVAEGLPRGGPRGEHDASPGPQRVDGGRLVRVEPVDAARRESLDDPGVQRIGGVGVAGRPALERRPERDPFAGLRVEGEPVEGVDGVGPVAAGLHAGGGRRLRGRVEVAEAGQTGGRGRHPHVNESAAPRRRGSRQTATGPRARRASWCPSRSRPGS